MIKNKWENIMNINYVHTFERPENAVDRGNLKVNVIDRRTKRPVMNARVEISYTGRPDSVIEELVTDDSGLTPTIALPAPPVEYSMEPQDSQPYSEYNVKITASGYVDMLISGSEIFSGDQLNKFLDTFFYNDDGKLCILLNGMSSFGYDNPSFMYLGSKGDELFYMCLCRYMESYPESVAYYDSNNLMVVIKEEDGYKVCNDDFLWLISF